MILIYKDAQILDLEWFNKIKFPGEFRFTSSFEEYMSADNSHKIAFTTHRLRCDPDNAHTAYTGFEDLINKLSSVSDLVFTFESELHHYHWRIWEQCHHDNVYWVVTGQVNDREDINSHIIFWGDWFRTTTDVYKRLPEKLAQVDPYVTKPRMFDALLGSPKPHRDFVATAVKEHGLQDKFILTYGGDWKNDEFYAKDYFIWESDVVLKDPELIGTANRVYYCDVLAHLSQIIPLKVFNDTAYSIIAETDHNNTLSFFSEKTAKPMMTRRLFVAFSGYKFLQNLRSFGFRTFDGIIDESYDLILDDTVRYTAAFEQVKKLCAMDQQAVYDQIRPITEHNYDLIMNQDWVAYAAAGIQRAINSAHFSLV
jgi:hypothetical protein